MNALFEAARAGDAAAIRSILDADSTLDINAKDESGDSPLVLAAQGGHEEAAVELLNRGADQSEAIARGFATNGAEESQGQAADGSNGHGPNGEPGSAAGGFAPIPTDVYGGYQLPDGSMAYGAMPGYPPQFAGNPGQPAFYHDPMMFPHPGAAPFGFPPMGQRPRQSTSGFAHGRKPSTSGKLPPPEVARTIACRYYPNCRNGDSCIFAHIDGEGAEAPKRSPSGPHQEAPGQQGGFAAPPMNFYAGPGPYGSLPPQFFPPPHAMQQGAHMGMPFPGSHVPMPLHYQPQEGSQPGQLKTLSPNGQQASSPSTPAAPESLQNGVASSPAAPSQSVDKEESNETATEPQPRAADDEQPVPSSSLSPPQDSAEQAEKSRRQSFNSFLHSHAIPFQPSSQGNGASAIPVAPAAAMQGFGYQGFAGRGKPRGRGGAVVGLGRGPRPRTPCTFFAKNMCRYGPECLYPHILPDGTDARRLPGVNGTMPLGAQEGAPRGAGRPGVNGASVNGSRPLAEEQMALGQQAKKAAGLPPIPSAEVTGTPNGSFYDGLKTNANGSSQEKPAEATFVPSKPSATAMAEAGAKNAASAPTAPAANTTASKQSQEQQQPQQQQPTQQNGSQTSSQSRKNQRGNQNGSNASKKAAAAAAAAAAATPAQRVPVGADFPALAASPNGHPAGGSAAPIAPVPTSPKGETAASKINFSAVLSAPAPPAKKKPEASQAKAVNGENAVDGQENPNDSEADGVTADVETSSEHKSEANGAAKANGTAPANGSASSKEKAGLNGSTKPRASKQGAAGSKGAWGKSNAQTAAPAAVKQPELDDDDFQLVKGRSHSKKAPVQAAGRGAAPAAGAAAGGKFANVAKAAVAA